MLFLDGLVCVCWRCYEFRIKRIALLSIGIEAVVNVVMRKSQRLEGESDGYDAGRRTNDVLVGQKWWLRFDFTTSPSFETFVRERQFLLDNRLIEIRSHKYVTTPEVSL